MKSEACLVCGQFGMEKRTSSAGGRSGFDCPGQSVGRWSIFLRKGRTRRLAVAFLFLGSYFGSNAVAVESAKITVDVSKHRRRSSTRTLWNFLRRNQSCWRWRLIRGTREESRVRRRQSSTRLPATRFLRCATTDSPFLEAARSKRLADAVERRQQMARLDDGSVWRK